MSLEYEVPLISLLFVLLLGIVYFSKPKIGLLENKYYRNIIIMSFIECLLSLIAHLITAINSYDTVIGKYFNIINIINMCVSTLFVGIFMSLFCYILFITSKKAIKNEKHILYFYYGFLIIYFATTFFTKIDIIKIGTVTNIRGSTIMLSYAFTFLFLLLSVIVSVAVSISNRKKLDIRYLAAFIICVLMIIIYFVTLFVPGIILYDFALAVLCYVMYFTIENPDVKMIQQLEIAKDSADKANHAKTDFLSSMSHEIRTPLNAIVGFSDCIMETDNIEEAKENAKDIVNASQTLLEIVNGILDISKIEAGKLEISNSRYNALSTFEELAKLITPKMHEKGLDFTYNIAPDLPNTLYGDHANIKKIVTNLLSNACKYTDKGYVHYEVKCVNTNNVCKLIISVEDSGRGIKKENVDKLFTKFQRLDEDRNTTIEGTGLGLAITKQLIELMGGRIIVHTVYGEGSKFTVILNQKIDNGPVEEESKVKTTLDLENIRILMVDDTPLNLKVTAKLLEKYHANQLVTCNSGFECLDRIQRGEKYDIILLDDMMPKMSGVITLQKLKEIPGFHIPTVALTANAITGMREKYLADGFDDYLAKPIEKDQLIRVLNQILGGTPTEEITVPDTEQESREDSPTKLIPVVSLDIKEEKETGRQYLEEMGVDINHALELLGDMEMYNMTLHDFAKEAEEKWKRIKEYKDASNMSDYAIEVHSLKSDCKYLGFMKLADISYQHELKSKENDIEYIQNHFQELEEEYKKILDIVKEYERNNSIKD